MIMFGSRFFTGCALLQPRLSLNPQETADLVSFTEDILNGKLHFLCNASLVDKN